MRTPIVDFLKAYREKMPVRMHMPGHKGASILGFEGFDLTEIDGADELFEAQGIIAESEKNVSQLFGCSTYYSTQGSTLGIQTMCMLLYYMAKSENKKPKILAGRNAHRSFIHAAALLDLDVEWLYGIGDYLSCKITREILEEAILQYQPTAVYLTNPDYLGNCLDISILSSVCKKHNVYLAVDNAHGAYLHFLENSLHPMDLGADMCCDSAHKTLPVLTGGAYLHVSDAIQQEWGKNIKHYMEYFSSTSPSYLILASLDAANAILDTTFKKDLSKCIEQVSMLKRILQEYGYSVLNGEPMKITIDAKAFGYTGKEIASCLIAQGIYPEFYDADYLVLMPSPYNTSKDWLCLEQCLCHLKKKSVIHEMAPKQAKAKKVWSIREALFAQSKVVGLDQALGQICSSVAVSCPPAILPMIPGERINASAIEMMRYYGIESVQIVWNRQKKEDI